MTTRTYRSDIDGLRAIAVLAVVGFHAFPGRISGGFAGVDVFFVISGFLISGLIIAELEAGDFSFVRFYARRARRIFPALVTVLLATLALGWVLLLPDEFSRLGAHVVAGSFFSSNFLLWHEAGYFDASAVTKPLLHLWSLGIEEQFYLVWPILLVAIWRRQRHQILVIAAIALLSFAFNVARVHGDLTGTFYSPATRGWELMIGALLAVAMRNRAEPSHLGWWQHATSIVGCTFLIVSFATFRAQMLFPGWYALLPTAGTALVIASSGNAWMNRRLLSSRPAVFIGLISYPLYLWHWPLLVFLRLGMESFPGASDHEGALILGALAVAFVAAVATYRFIELPVRRRTPLGPLAARLALALSATAVLGAVITQRPRVRLSGDPDVVRAVAARSDWLNASIGDGTHYTAGLRADPSIVVAGDSHAEAYFFAAQRAEQQMTSAPVTAFLTHRGCVFLPMVLGDACAEHYRQAFAVMMAPSVRRVVIISDWARYTDERFGRLPHGSTLLTMPDGRMATPEQADSVFHLLAADLAALRARGKDVVIILSHPGSPRADPMLLARRSRVPFLPTLATQTPFAASFPLEEFEKHVAWIHGELAMVAGLSDARQIDPAEFLCPKGACITMDERGTPIRSDADHLRPFAVSRFLSYVPALLSFNERPAIK